MSKRITAYAHVGNFGRTFTELVLEGVDVSALPAPEDFTGVTVTKVEAEENKLYLTVEPFACGFGKTFFVECANKEFSFTFEEIDEIKTAWADEFTYHKEGDVLYRLYSPKCAEPRPLVLFLHGGGEGGDNNEAQMLNTMGAANWAERYPDLYVMAPQAPGFVNAAKVADTSSMVRNSSKGLMPGGSGGKTGWHREYLADICGIIRKMIADGKVLADRVYVTGMSMGGGGTLKALSVGRDLFAAAAPICPSMNEETFSILQNLGDMKLWISTAFVDYAMARHKYIVDGVMKLVREGNKNAFLTLYSPDELAKYGIGCDPDMTVEQQVMSNHASWVLTYNNEYGIMDWLVNQVK